VALANSRLAGALKAGTDGSMPLYTTSRGTRKKPFTSSAARCDALMQAMVATWRCTTRRTAAFRPGTRLNVPAVRAARWQCRVAVAAPEHKNLVRQNSK